MKSRQKERVCVCGNNMLADTLLAVPESELWLVWHTLFNYALMHSTRHLPEGVFFFFACAWLAILPACVDIILIVILSGRRVSSKRLQTSFTSPTLRGTTLRSPPSTWTGEHDCCSLFHKLFRGVSESLGGGCCGGEFGKWSFSACSGKDRVTPVHPCRRRRIRSKGAM